VREGAFAPSLKTLSLLWRGVKKKSQREAKPQIHYREFKRDEVPLQKKSSPSP
jgi:hypothetical protein